MGNIGGDLEHGIRSLGSITFLFARQTAAKERLGVGISRRVICRGSHLACAAILELGSCLHSSIRRDVVSRPPDSPNASRVVAGIPFLPRIDTGVSAFAMVCVVRSAKSLGRNEPLLENQSARRKPDIARHFESSTCCNARVSRINSLFRLDLANTVGGSESDSVEARRDSVVLWKRGFSKTGRRSDRGQRRFGRSFVGWIHG